MNLYQTELLDYNYFDILLYVKISTHAKLKFLK